MNTFIKTSTIAATLFATLFAANLASAADLTIQIDQIKSVEGNLMVALYDKAANFPYQPVRARKVAVQAGDNLIQFTDLPIGDYAVAVYHDANNNGHIDQNEVGIPTESYGFSNNVVFPKGHKGPPTFDAVKFSVSAALPHTQTQTQTRISLR